MVKIFDNGVGFGGGGRNKDPPCHHCHPVTELIPSLSEDIVLWRSLASRPTALDRSGLLPPQKKVQTSGAEKGLNGGERRVRQTARHRSRAVHLWYYTGTPTWMVLTSTIASAILGTLDIFISVNVLTTSESSKQYKGFSKIGYLIEDLRLYLKTCPHSCFPLFTLTVFIYNNQGTSCI